ncbi:MAG: TVP38/TMEM64 family protein [Halioglobus sp.]
MAILVGAMVYFDTDQQVLQLMRWLETQGLTALLWFVLILALVVVLTLPGILFTTGAGFVFGVAQGTAVVVVGTMLGAVVAFLSARYLAGEGARRFILSNKWMSVINRGLGTKGFRIVLLTRLMPFFPGKLANYVFGLSQVSLRDFVFASVLGIIPFSLNNVYLGSIAADLATLGSRNTERTPLEWSLYAVGFAASIALVVYLNRLAGRMLATELGDGRTAPASSGVNRGDSGGV